MARELMDLGDDHTYSKFSSYSQPDAIVGIIVWHPVTPQCPQSCRDLGSCGGAVLFDVPGPDYGPRPRWQVISLDPLTLSPSLLCHCGDHGFIQDGRWVRC